MAALMPASPYPKDADLQRIEPLIEPPLMRRTSRWPDVLFSVLAHGAALLTLALMAGIVVSLFIGASPAIHEYGLSFLWRRQWDPVQEQFGGLVMIYGTLTTSL